jgi:cytochrome c-type biogenesis protein CcmH/NrfG
MTDLSTFQEDFVLLLEAGFVAINQSDEDAAAKLFHAAQLLNPESSAPKIGLAAIALHKLELKRAIKLLEEILQKEPQNIRASCLLGISYLLSNKNIEEGERRLKDASEHGDDPATRKLGQLWLEVLDKGIRKSDSPMSPQAPKKQSKAKTSP